MKKFRTLILIAVAICLTFALLCGCNAGNDSYQEDDSSHISAPDSSDDTQDTDNSGSSDDTQDTDNSGSSDDTQDTNNSGSSDDTQGSDNSGSSDDTQGSDNSGGSDNDDEDSTVYEVEAPGHGPADVSNVTSVGGVPMVTLNNGVKMPRFGLGTQIQSLESGDLGVLNRTSRDAVAAALRAGYRHLDTAHGYYNERGVGQGIIESGVDRSEIWITSKLWPSEYNDAYNAVDRLLTRLQVEYVDLVYLHHPAGSIQNIVSAWQGLERAYREGKIRAIGISNFDNRMAAFNAIMDEEIKPQIMQIECHPFAQRTDTRRLAEQYNIQVECWYPLGHADERLLTSDVLEAVANAHGKSVVQIILRWHMQEGFSAIPGSRNPAHISENIDIFDFELSDAEMESIRALDGTRRYFNINYEMMGGMFTSPPREWNGSF